VVIKTTGDRIADRPLAEIGGKGLFTKEIEEGLLGGSIDLAVHSMKDMPTWLPDGLEISTILEREDPRDAFISARAAGVRDLPQNAVVGTSSLRRAAQLRHIRPDIETVTYRGNVQTRLKKLEAGEVDATFLALAGLRRLGLEKVVTEAVDPGDMLPAVAQGAIGIEIHKDNDKVRDLLGPLDHKPTAIAVAMERSFLAALDGSCQTPIAGLATIDASGAVDFSGEIISPDGVTRHATTRQCASDDVAAAGADAGAELKARGGPDFFAGI